MSRLPHVRLRQRFPQALPRRNYPTDIAESAQSNALGPRHISALRMWKRSNNENEY